MTTIDPTLRAWSAELLRLAVAVGDGNWATSTPESLARSCWQEDFRNGLTPRQALANAYGYRPSEQDKSFLSALQQISDAPGSIEAHALPHATIGEWVDRAALAIACASGLDMDAARQWASELYDRHLAHHGRSVTLNTDPARAAKRDWHLAFNIQALPDGRFCRTLDRQDGDLPDTDGAVYVTPEEFERVWDAYYATHPDADDSGDHEAFHE